MEIIYATSPSCPNCKTFKPKFEAAKLKYPNVKFTEVPLNAELDAKYFNNENLIPAIVRIDGNKQVYAIGDLAEGVFHKMIETGEVPPRPVVQPEDQKLAWLYGKYGEITFRLKLLQDDATLLKEKAQIETSLMQMTFKRMSAPVYKQQPPSCATNPITRAIVNWWNTDCEKCLRIRSILTLGYLNKANKR